MASKKWGAHLEAHARVTASSVVQFEIGMAEIHAGTAAPVSHTRPSTFSVWVGVGRTTSDVVADWRRRLATEATVTNAPAIEK